MDQRAQDGEYSNGDEERFGEFHRDEQEAARG
jgi:hypothetical protein